MQHGSADVARAYSAAPSQQVDGVAPGPVAQRLAALAALYCRHTPFERGRWRISRAAQRGVGQRVATIRTRDDFRMRVDTRDFIQRTIYLTGTWDDSVLAAMHRLLRRGDLFVDVGAHVGYFALLAARMGARVIAFEPNPGCFAALVHNAALNNFRDIAARAIGISDHCGQDKLYIESETNLGASSLKSGASRHYDIKLDTLDAQLRDETPRLLKLDIEGAELMAIKGGSRLLARTGAVICEISEYSLRQLGGSKEELFALMAGHGFRVDIISPVRRSTHSDSDICFQYDVLFTRDGARTPD